MRALVLTVLTSLAIGGCDGAERPPDGAIGDDAGLDEPVAEPAAPLAVTWPSWGECPAGWAPVAVEEARACEPWPAEAPPACEGLEARFPSSVACAPVGSCPSGDWPEDLSTAGRVWYVAEGFLEGSGTEADPFTDLADAVAAAQDGDLIALGPGSFIAFPVLARDVTLRGLCPGRTRLRGSLVVEGATATVEGIEISSFNRAVTVRAGGSLALSDVVVSEAHGLAILVMGGALDAERLVVRDVMPDSFGDLGRGLLVQAATATVRSGVFERTTELAVVALGAEATVALEDVAILDTRIGSLGIGRGLTATEGARLTAERTIVEGSREAGAVADGAALELRDSLIRGTGPGPTDELGLGLVAQRGATVTLERVWVREALRAGLQIADPGTGLTAADVLVESVAPQRADALLGRGVTVALGAQLEADRLLVRRTADSGIAILNPETSASLRDVVVRDTALGDMEISRSLVVGLGARATVDRVDVAGAREVGVLVSDSTLAGTDLWVRDTEDETTPGLLGHGLHVVSSEVTLERVLLARNRGAGLLAGLAGTTVVLRDLTVRDTRERACAGDACAGFGAGIGVTSLEGASIDLERFRVEGGALCGLQVASGASLDAREGHVVGHPIGVNVQVPGYDIARLTTRVVYDNAVNLDATELVLPEVQPSEAP